MIFSWLRRLRRNTILSEPFPAEWLEHLERNVPHYALLLAAEQQHLRDDTQVFVAEKHWEGCGGLELTDEMKVTIAAQACLLVVGIDEDLFRNVLSVLVYPSAYQVPTENWEEGFSIVGVAAREGEAWYRGPVVLNWTDVMRDSRRLGRGRNVVWHEFAHQIDMLDRSTNGTPPLADPRQRKRWHEVMTAEFDRLVSDVDEGRDTLLDPYGTENETEFFSVVTECFFDRPVAMQARHPQLYELLAGYYRQDPAARFAAGRG